ncbi:MAG: cation diffusion facilitator family transporter [Candidatus Eisenbacteria bacterium]|uniref:Cation diffusion facilitator family transporter n=1 Tax=Eiseniibacteriota bacterium TaxID=2212470 RepID=A0A956LXI8_UNCEI|nr:cation diffusion facilitator family transporter [Candidatus Eisenbacteria bacterium]
MSDHHTHASSRRRLAWAFGITAAFLIAEVIGGIISGSLALLADAGHMTTDAASLALAWVAMRASERPADPRRTYGYHRFQVLAALVNGLGLFAIVIAITFEAIQRFMTPVPVMGRPMLVVAGLGLLANLAAFLILHGGDRQNINVRGATLHVASDLLGSVGAIVAALVILRTGWTPIDPILSVVVAALILRSAWQLIHRSSHILLEGAPEWLDVTVLERELVQAVPTLESVHHVHVWSLTNEHPMLTMHVTLRGDCGDPTEAVRATKQVLRETYGITHSTIEVDASGCADDDPVLSASSASPSRTV